MFGSCFCLFLGRYYVLVCGLVWEVLMVCSVGRCGVLGKMGYCCCSKPDFWLSSNHVVFATPALVLTLFMPRQASGRQSGVEPAALRLYLSHGHPTSAHDILMDSVHHQDRGARQLAEMLLSVRINRGSRRSMSHAVRDFADGSGEGRDLCHGGLASLAVLSKLSGVLQMRRWAMPREPVGEHRALHGLHRGAR